MTATNSSFGLLKDKALFWFYEKLNRTLAPHIGKNQTVELIKNYNLREDDIFIVTYMKSGTTLLQMLMYQLMTDGRMDFEHIYEKTPYLDKSLMLNEPIDSYPSPRIIKTHFYQTAFPKDTKGKFIVCVRNGMDVAVSKYHHVKNYYFHDITWEQYHKDVWLNEQESWFTHVKQWMENTHGLDVHYLYYEDLIKNKRQAIEGIADFLGLSPSEETYQRVIERTDFAYMKEHEAKFGEKAPEPYEEAFYSTGFGHKHFSPQQQSMFAQLYQQHLGRYGLRHGLKTAPSRPASVRTL